MAVLNWNSCSISSVTFLMVLCVSLLRSLAIGLVATTWSPFDCLSSGAKSGTSLHTRPRKRYAPSTPAFLHSRSFSGGAAQREQRRAVAAPYPTVECPGSPMFFLDSDHFSQRPRSTG